MKNGYLSNRSSPSRHKHDVHVRVVQLQPVPEWGAAVDAVDIQLQQQWLLVGRQQVSALLTDAHIGWVDQLQKTKCYEWRWFWKKCLYQVSSRITASPVNVAACGGITKLFRIFTFSIHSYMDSSVHQWFLVKLKTKPAASASLHASFLGRFFSFWPP